MLQTHRNVKCIMLLNQKMAGPKTVTKVNIRQL